MFSEFVIHSGVPLTRRTKHARNIRTFRKARKLSLKKRGERASALAIRAVSSSSAEENEQLTLTRRERSWSTVEENPGARACVTLCTLKSRPSYSRRALVSENNREILIDALDPGYRADGERGACGGEGRDILECHDPIVVTRRVAH